MLKKFCYSCRRVRDISEFSLRPSGNPEEQCDECLDRNLRRKTIPKAYPSDRPGLLSRMDHEEPVKHLFPIKKKKKAIQARKDKLTPPVKRVSERPKNVKKGFTDEDYMENYIKPFILEDGDAFNQYRLRRYWRRSGTWAYRLMARLEKAGYIAVSRGVANRNNTYYLTDKAYEFLGLSRDDTGVYLQFVDL